MAFCMKHHTIFSHLFLIEWSFGNTIRSPPTGCWLQWMVGLGRAPVAHLLDDHLGRISSSDYLFQRRSPTNQYIWYCGSYRRTLDASCSPGPCYSPLSNGTCAGQSHPQDPPRTHTCLFWGRGRFCQRWGGECCPYSGSASLPPQRPSWLGHLENP